MRVMSIRAQLLSFMMRRTIKGQMNNIGENVEGFREQMAGASLLTPKLPEEVKVETVSAGGVNCEWVAWEGVTEHRVLMYLHGGGYVFGGLDSHRDIAWRLSKESGMRVLLVDYRLAPEHPFPAAVEDATTCYRWLQDEGYKPHQIVMGGDSAGGGLTLATLVNLKNLGISKPSGAILLSPWVDLSLGGSSITTNAKSDAMLSPGSLEQMAKLYLGELDRKAPLASPLFADLSGLPPMLVHVSNTEVLLGDAERLVEKVKEAGGDAVLEVWPKMPHVFQVFAGRIPEGKVAIVKLAEFIKKRAAEA